MGCLPGYLLGCTSLPMYKHTNQPSTEIHRSNPRIVSVCSRTLVPDQNRRTPKLRGPSVLACNSTSERQKEESHNCPTQPKGGGHLDCCTNYPPTHNRFKPSSRTIYFPFPLVNRRLILFDRIPSNPQP